MRESIFTRLTVLDVLNVDQTRTADQRGRFLCPAHADRTPSAHIHPSGRGWTCFACGRNGFAGSIAGLVMALGHAATLAEAAAWLEETLL